MLKHYLTMAFRRFKTNRTVFILNIFGLFIGILCCSYIMLWVFNELSYDNFHEKRNRIYRVNKIWRKGEMAHYASTPAPLGKTLKSDFPEIEETVRFDFAPQMSVRYKDKKFFENGIALSDQSILDVFTFPFYEGTKKDALANKNSVLLTRSIARKYFGEMSPIGEELTFAGKYHFIIKGVLEDIPSNSHLSFNFLISFDNVMDILGQNQDGFTDWHNSSFYTYVLLQEEGQSELLNSKIEKYLNRFIPDSTSSLYLQPLSEIYLHSSDLKGNKQSIGDITTVILFSIFALLVLLIACLNYVNLYTAKALSSAREVGLRKIFGAQRINLFAQFFTETVIYFFIAIFGSIFAVFLTLSNFNQLSNKSISPGDVLAPQMIIGYLVIMVSTSLLSCSYPVLYLSRFKPKIIFGEYSPSGIGTNKLRRNLVILQYTITILLVLSTMTIYRQIGLLINKDLGFNKENLLVIKLNDFIKDNYALFRNSLLSNTAIINCTASSSPPQWNSDSSTTEIAWTGKNPQEDYLIRGVGVDYDFFETFGITFVEGRSFSIKYPSDKGSYIINQRAQRMMGGRLVVGDQISFMNKPGKIIGIVKDYNFKPLTNDIEPLIIRLYDKQWLNYSYIRFDPNKKKQAISHLENVFNECSPSEPFSYYIVNQIIESIYSSFIQIGKILLYLSIFAILLASLGLFGLASYISQSRAKEVAIRKVLGDSTSSLIWRINMQFIKWISISNIIALPVGYYIINKQLDYFAFRVELDIWSILLIGTMIMLLALITVSWNIIKTARAHPINSLRHN